MQLQLNIVQAISAGGRYSLALLADCEGGSTLRAWGSDFENQLGNGTARSSKFPITVLGIGFEDCASTVGGTVGGLTGTGLELQNNGGDSLPMLANGSFTFATPLADGVAYNVTVSTQPAGQTCTVSNGSGTISGANVTDVAITCTANQPPTASFTHTPA